MQAEAGYVGMVAPSEDGGIMVDVEVRRAGVGWYFRHFEGKVCMGPWRSMDLLVYLLHKNIEIYPHCIWG